MNANVAFVWVWPGKPSYAQMCLDFLGCMWRYGQVLNSWIEQFIFRTCNGCFFIKIPVVKFCIDVS